MEKEKVHADQKVTTLSKGNDLRPPRRADMPEHYKRGFKRLWLAICTPWMAYWVYQYLTEQSDDAVFWGLLVPVGSLVLFVVGAWVWRGFLPAKPADGVLSPLEGEKKRAPDIIDRIANLPIPKSVYAIITVVGPITGFIFGVFFLKYAGLTIAVPAIFVAIVYGACRRLSAARTHYRLSFAILTGHAAWMILAALMFIGSAGDAKPVEVLIEGLFVLAGVFWLFRSRSEKAVLTLLVYCVIGIAFNLHMMNELSPGSRAETGCAVHIVLHLAATVALTAGLLESRRKTSA